LKILTVLAVTGGERPTRGKHIGRGIEAGKRKCRGGGKISCRPSVQVGVTVKKELNSSDLLASQEGGR